MGNRPLLGFAAVQLPPGVPKPEVGLPQGQWREPHPHPAGVWGSLDAYTVRGSRLSISVSSPVGVGKKRDPRGCFVHLRSALPRLGVQASFSRALCKA